MWAAARSIRPFTYIAVVDFRLFAGVHGTAYIPVPNL